MAISSPWFERSDVVPLHSNGRLIDVRRAVSRWAWFWLHPEPSPREEALAASDAGRSNAAFLSFHPMLFDGHRWRVSTQAFRS
jgi:hypothetical protein